METSPDRLPAARAAMALAPLALALILTGCGDYSADYPELMPTQQLLADPALPPHAASAARSPLAVETGLMARANTLPHRAASPAGSDDLTVRAQALRHRAQALSQTPVGDSAEDDDAACAPDAGACPTPAPATP